MGERSAIEWTDATWNPWHGCTKVSPGCKHCYMYREKKQYGQNPAIVVRSKTTFTNPLKWREPKRIFTCSWSDFFHEAADVWRHEAWDIIRRTPQHTYLVLTKRAERIHHCLPPLWGFKGWPNVWLGVSVETQEYCWRIAELVQIPAVVRFISAEPLLGPLNLKPWLLRLTDNRGSDCGIDWVIAGGESGPKARPMDLAWVRALRRAVPRGRPRRRVLPEASSGGSPTSAAVSRRSSDGRRWTELPV